MSQTTARLCQGCREPVVMVDHGRPFPLQGVLVICADPLKVRCPSCDTVTLWSREVTLKR